MIKNKYVRLMRLDKPIGIYLSLLPALWAVAFASRSWMQLIIYSLIMIIGDISTRSAGCIINDFFDRKLDAKVKRTKSRPLASGEVTVKEAFTLLLICGSISFCILLTLPGLSIICGLLSIPMILIYPLFKRFTHYPQVFLGFAFNMGALIGWFAVSPYFSYSVVTLYIACILWTIGYDTIYGHQDRSDDILANSKSLSIKVGEKTPEFVWALYKIMMVFFLITGLSSGMNLTFYFVSAFAAYYLYWQAIALDINNPLDCKEKFKSNGHIGLILWVAILIGKI